MLEAETLAPPTVIVFRNPLDVTDFAASVAIPGEDIFTWLLQHYPDGFGRPISLIYNGKSLAIEESDIPFKDGDHLAILVGPAGPAFATALVVALISAAATIAATLIVNLIFGKPKQKANRQSADPVYSLDGGANSARLGEPVPVGYGTFITYPDYVSPPYTFFKDNQQYLDQILCVGQGDYSIHDVFIEDTPGTQLVASNIMSYQFFPFDRHLRRMGNIEDNTGVSERMLTSLEVNDIELSGVSTPTGGAIFTSYADTGAPGTLFMYNEPPDTVGPGSTGSLYWPGNGYFPFTVVSIVTDVVYTDLTVLPNGARVNVSIAQGSSNVGMTAGPFTLSRPGIQGERVYTDIVFPNGVYGVNATTGAFIDKTVQWNTIIQKINDDGSSNGAPTIINESFTARTNTPQRITKEYAVAAGRYTVQINRVTAADVDNKSQSNMVWTGLRFKLLIVNEFVYGYTTLLAVRLRATSGISSDAANKIRVKATRMLPHLGAGPLVETQSPADAFINVLFNTNYGANRPLSEIDIAKLTTLDAHWGAEGQFNAIFTTRSTVWEALGLICQPVVCIPIVAGSKITMVQDGLKSISTQMFTSANMADGSFNASYSFNRPGDHKGMRVEYRSAVDFSVQTEAYSDDPTAIDFENVSLFGCTSKTIAQAYARLLWQRKLYQKQNFAFDTELEGMIPTIGERVSIANDVIDWSHSGQVVGVTPGSPTQIILDRAVNLIGMVNPVIVLRADNGSPSAAYPVAQGTTAFTYTFTGALPFSFTPGDAIALWAIGEQSRIMRPVLITSVAAQGQQSVSVGAIKYDPRVYANTLAFLQVPI